MGEVVLLLDRDSLKYFSVSRKPFLALWNSTFLVIFLQLLKEKMEGTSEIQVLGETQEPIIDVDELDCVCVCAA